MAPTGSRWKIIDAVKSPQIKFLMLVTILVEASFGLAVVQLPEQHRIWAYIAMAVVLTSALTAFLLYYNMEGKRQRQWKKEDLSSADQATFTHPDANQSVQKIARLAKLGDLRTTLSELLSLQNAPADIRQTFVHTNPIAPQRDLILRFLERDRDHRPSVNRYVAIARPIDVYFAAHCLNLQKDYGPERMQTHLVLTDSSSDMGQAFANYTVVDDTTVVTFPQLTGDLPDVTTQPDNSPASFGIGVYESSVFAEGVRNYMSDCLKMTGRADVSAEQALDDIQRQFWADNRSAYLMAVAWAIAKALRADEQASKGAEYFSVVGSTVDLRRDASPNDIDIVLLYDELDPTILDAIERTIDNVSESFSFTTRSFRPFYSSCPVKPAWTRSGQFPLQILLHDANTIRHWAPYAARHRRLHHRSLYGDFPRGVGDRTFTLQEVLDGNFGIVSCRRSIEDGFVRAKSWQTSGHTCSYKPVREDISEDRVMEAFLAYAVKWNVYNVHSASNSPFDEDDAVDAKGSAGRVLEWLDAPDEIRSLVEEVSTPGMPLSNPTATDERKRVVVGFLKLLEEKVANV